MPPLWKVQADAAVKQGWCDKSVLSAEAVGPTQAETKED